MVMAAPYSACRSYPFIAWVSRAPSRSTHGGQQLCAEGKGKKSTVFSAFPAEELSWKREKKVEFVGLKGEHIFPASGHFDGKLVLLALKQPRT